MKYLVLLLVSFSLSNFRAQTTTPTLEETISWIEGKMDFSHPMIIGGTARSSVKIDKKTKVLTYQNTYFTPGKPTQTTTYFVPLKSINPNNIRVQESNGDYWVHIYTNNNKYDIKWQSQYDYQSQPDPTTTTHNTISFMIPRSELDATPDFANRLKTALSHLIKLCGGTGEKF